MGDNLKTVHVTDRIDRLPEWSGGKLSEVLSWIDSLGERCKVLISSNEKETEAVLFAGYLPRPGDLFKERPKTSGDECDVKAVYVRYPKSKEYSFVPMYVIVLNNEQ